MKWFQDRKVSWTSMAIILGLPTLLGFIAWLIFILQDPVKWCSVRVADTKLATSTISDCTSIVLSLIHWLGWACMALIGCVIVAFLVIVTRDLKAGIDAQGWGLRIKTGGDDEPQTPADAADVVAGAAVGAASSIKDHAPGGI